MNASISARLIKKITPKAVYGTLNPDLPQPIKERRDLYDLFGTVVKTRTGHTDYGDWLQFVGEFEAVTPDGEIFRAPRCHIPQPFEDMLFTQLAQVQATDPKASVQFAVRISMVPPTKGKPSAVGYEFQVTPLVESRDTNPLALLKETAYKNHPQIGAPVAQRAIGGAKR